MKNYSVISGIVVVLLMLGISAACADPLLDEGYDENTEITIRGKVSDIHRGPRGPVIIKLASDNKAYYVLTAPPWYLERQGISFSPGVELEVKGSKSFGRDGLLYIISREIKDAATGRIILLRDKTCRPRWLEQGRRGERH